VLSVVIAAVLALLAVPVSEAIAVEPTLSLPAYGYYGQLSHSIVGTDAFERGPPVRTSTTCTYDAVARWSRGASARSGLAATRPAYTYNDLAEAVQVVVSTATVSDTLAGAPRAIVAAKAEVPTVVFSRSRAPGIAGTFDDAVANGAPTQLNRVGTAARDANRRAALRGQSPAPAGQSLDDYPFACSAQGGCGATVRSVPVGEQSYQGGVLSRFFQDNGIGVGDPFNVMFGP